MVWHMLFICAGLKKIEFDTKINAWRCRNGRLNIYCYIYSWTIKLELMCRCDVGQPMPICALRAVTSTPHPCLTRRFIKIAIRSGTEASNGGLTLITEGRPGEANICLYLEHWNCPAIGMDAPMNRPRLPPRNSLFFFPGRVALYERG